MYYLACVINWKINHYTFLRIIYYKTKNPELFPNYLFDARHLLYIISHEKPTYSTKHADRYKAYIYYKHYRAADGGQPAVIRVRKSGLENIFFFKNKNFHCKSDIELPAYVDFRERMVPYIVINFNLGTGQSRLAKRFCKQ
jgi:hypothetical protein